MPIFAPCFRLSASYFCLIMKPKETTITMKKKHQYEAPALSFVEMETANMLAGSVNISDEITNDDAVMSKKRKQSIWTDAWE